MTHKVFLIFTFFLISCATTPITGTKKFIITSPAEENDLGEKAYKDILKHEKVNNRSELAEQVKIIGQRLARVAGRSDFEWEFNVFESSQINAFCLPGGKVGFYSGMAKVANTPARVAAVLAHEIAHAMARHGGQRMSAQIGQELLMGILTVTAFGELPKGKRQLVLAALGVGTTVAFILPYSRSNESEADEIGLVLMANAGFDPREAVVLWQRMEEITGSSGPGFLSTHPTNRQRQERLNELMPSALQIYQKHKL
ncbi:MAG: M48 family metallopeptidase [Bdellovibrio sp.]|nr:M48 family metallopeptidase [Bdellovibrio sp.]